MHVDVERLKEAADPLTVAEAIGMDIQSHGRRVSILCPAHNDVNHGSCFLTEKGYKCYSCHSTNDIIGMVCQFKKVSFLEAVKIIASLYGGVEQYAGGGADGQRASARLPSKQECDLIGLKNNPVYVQIGESHRDKLDFNQGLYRTELILASLSEERPRYKVYQLVENNPLRTLMEYDEEKYLQVIADHCERTLKSLERIASTLQTTSHSYGLSPIEIQVRDSILSEMSAQQAQLCIQGLISQVCAVAEKHADYPLTPLMQREQADMQMVVLMIKDKYLSSQDIPF